MSGKILRLSRLLFPNANVGLIVPIDHGLTMGPLPGLEDLSLVTRWLNAGFQTGIIAHKGVLQRLSQLGLQGHGSALLHLNGMSTLAKNPNQKERLTSMETALRLGADGVSLQINFDGQNNRENMMLLGQIVDEADAFGLPVLTMLYDKTEARNNVTRQRHLLRIAVELGTDALKLDVPENRETIPEIIEGVTQHTRVFFAGGSLCTDEHTLNLARLVVRSGAHGLCVGRNVFQKQKPQDFLGELRSALLSPIELSFRAVENA